MVCLWDLSDVKTGRNYCAAQEENKLADSHVASTSLAGEDHSQEETHGSSAHVQRVRAGCPEKYAASGRGGVFFT